MTEQLTLLAEPVRSTPARPAYFENRGPRDWQPVTLATRYGHCQGGSGDPWFPLVRTKPLGPRNVAIRRSDGSSDVVPVRTLRRNQP